MNGIVMMPLIPASNIMYKGRRLSDVLDEGLAPTVVPIPHQQNIPIWGGAQVSPDWANLDAAHVTMSGELVGTDAGDYPVTATLADNCVWEDETTDPKELIWSIGRAPGSVVLDQTSLELTNDAATGYINVTRAGDGEITAESSDPDVATVTVNGTQIVVTGLKNGYAEITVTVAEGTNHSDSSTSLTVNVHLLDLSTWPNVQAAVQSGAAKQYMNVGDAIDIPIGIDGAIRSIQFKITLYASVLGFDHNSSREGVRTMHCAIGRLDDDDVSFYNDYSSYITTTVNYGICMNRVADWAGSSDGGWQDCTMRNESLPALLELLPQALRNVLKAQLKYTSNGSAGKHSTASSITQTTDTLFLLSEYEVLGTTNNSNPYEKNYQAQYDYYANGASPNRTAYKTCRNATTYCLRSQSSADESRFCTISNGLPSTGPSTTAYPFVPCCVIA